MSASDLSQLQKEFTNYQLLEEADISEALRAAVVPHNDNDSCHHRMDIVWSELGKKFPDGTFQFSHLSKVAKLVLVIPNSNAEEERVFSMVTKNKTAFRPNLKLDGTLCSILQIKLGNSDGPEPCYKYEPLKAILKTAKTATMAYNRAHSSAAANTFASSTLSSPLLSSS